MTPTSKKILGWSALIACGSILLFGSNFLLGVYGFRKGVAFAEWLTPKDAVVDDVVGKLDAIVPALWDADWTMSHVSKTSSGIEVAFLARRDVGVPVDDAARAFVRSQKPALCGAPWVSRVVHKDATVTLVFVDLFGGVVYRYGLEKSACPGDVVLIAD